VLELVMAPARADVNPSILLDSSHDVSDLHIRIFDSSKRRAILLCRSWYRDFRQQQLMKSCRLPPGISRSPTFAALRLSFNWARRRIILSSTEPTKLRIFVSSPGDVGREREIAGKVMERVDAHFGRDVKLEPYFWEHEPMRGTGDFQESIEDIGNFDIVMCILWSRLGSRLHPTKHHRPDGTPYKSGTEFEFEEAIRAYLIHKRPELLIYQRIEEPTFPPDPRDLHLQRLAQWDALKAFTQKWFNEGEEEKENLMTRSLLHYFAGVAHENYSAWTAAEAEFIKSAGCDRALLAHFERNSADRRKDLAITLSALARVLRHQSKLADAERASDEGLRLSSENHADKPDDP
jgi:hypothetical protein